MTDCYENIRVAETKDFSRFKQGALKYKLISHPPDAGEKTALVDRIENGYIYAFNFDASTGKNNNFVIRLSNLRDGQFRWASNEKLKEAKRRPAEPAGKDYINRLMAAEQQIKVLTDVIKELAKKIEQLTSSSA